MTVGTIISNNRVPQPLYFRTAFFHARTRNWRKNWLQDITQVTSLIYSQHENLMLNGNANISSKLYPIRLTNFFDCFGIRNDMRTSEGKFPTVFQFFAQASLLHTIIKTISSLCSTVVRTISRCSTADGPKAQVPADPTTVLLFFTVCFQDPAG